MTLANKTILITGANRGIGAALVRAALDRGAERVYAGMREPVSHADARVVPVRLDITDAGQIEAAAGEIESLDLLVNNAGLARPDDLSDRGVIEEHLAVNLFGPYALTQAMLPKLMASRGRVVNVLSLASLAPVPVIPAYSISKAAAYSLSQSLRALLAGHGIRIHVVLPGPVDTDMSRSLDVPKADPASVAHAIFDGVDAEDEEIFPDPMSAPLSTGWEASSVKALERANALFVPGALATQPS